MRPLLLVALLALPALAQDRKDDLRAPLDPFAAAKKGDWEVLVVRFSSANEEAPGAKRALVYRVTELTEKSTKLELESVPAKGKKSPLEVARGAPPLVLELLAAKPLEPLDVSVTDDKKTALGREIACKKLSFSSKRVVKQPTEDAIQTTTWAVWFSADVKGAGLVAIEFHEQHQGGGVPDDETDTTYDLAGFGNDETVLAGAAPSKVDLTPDPSKPQGEPAKLPIAFPSPKVGDWEAVFQEVRSKEKNFEDRKIVFTFKVTEVTDTAVTYDVEARTKEGKQTRRATYARSASLAEFLNLKPGNVHCMAVEETKRTVSGREFEAKKVTFLERDVQRVDVPSPHVQVIKVRSTVWLSAALPARGVLAIESHSRGSGGTEGSVEMDTKAELVGFGHGDKTEWGKRAGEVELSTK